MSDNSTPLIIPLSEATHREMPEGQYSHFLLRNVPVMTRVVIGPGKKTNPHYHEAEEQTYYVLNGRGRLYVEDEVYEISAQTGILIPPGHTHALENIGDEPLEWIMQYLWSGEVGYPVYQESDKD